MRIHQGIRNGHVVPYYQPHLKLTTKPKYNVGDNVFVNGRSKPWKIIEIAATGFIDGSTIGYWFEEQPLFPIYENELSKSPL